ncbi:hypothetical protein F2P79_009224 [Pimephales promelas]|nr:hypothetical protein F2P79_009224 [Pimephales promelas]
MSWAFPSVRPSRTVFTSEPPCALDYSGLYCKRTLFGPSIFWPGTALSPTRPSWQNCCWFLTGLCLWSWVLIYEYMITLR